MTTFASTIRIAADTDPDLVRLLADNVRKALSNLHARPTEISSEVCEDGSLRTTFSIDLGSDLEREGIVLNVATAEVRRIAAATLERDLTPGDGVPWPVARAAGP